MPRQVRAAGQSVTSPYQALISEYSKQAEEARGANLQRYAEAMSIYDKIIAQSAPGGPTERAYTAEIEKRSKQLTGEAALSLIGRGMGNVGLGAVPTARLQTESAYAEPARLRLEDMLQQRQSQALLGKAGFIERREDVYPDYGNLMTAAVAEGATGGRTYGGGGIPGSVAAQMAQTGLGESGFFGVPKQGTGATIRGAEYKEIMKKQGGQTPGTLAQAPSNSFSGVSDADLQERYQTAKNKGSALAGVYKREIDRRSTVT